MTPEISSGSQPQVPAAELIRSLGTAAGYQAFFSGPESVRFIAAEAGLASGEGEAAQQVVDLYWDNPELVDMYANRVVEAAYREHGDFVRARRNTLTGLPNRIEFREQLAAMIKRAEVRNRAAISGGKSPKSRDRILVFGIDLNEFKTVNDKRGHAAGDQVLINAAGALSSVLRTGDEGGFSDVIMHGEPPAQESDAEPVGDGSMMVVSHLAGDEFAVAVYLPAPDPDREIAADDRRGRMPVSVERQIAEIGGRIKGAVDGELAKVKIRGLSAAIGVAVWQEGMALEELLRNADMAMFHVKRNMQREALEGLSTVNRALLKVAAGLVRLVGHDPWRMASDVLGEKQARKA